MIHASHNNIITPGVAPTVALVDAGRVLMSKQLDPSNNDFVDIRPAIAWCPLSLGSTFRVLKNGNPRTSGLLSLALHWLTNTASLEHRCRHSREESISSIDSSAPCTHAAGGRGPTRLPPAG
jgi:hypothetical protein